MTEPEMTPCNGSRFLRADALGEQHSTLTRPLTKNNKLVLSARCTKLTRCSASIARPICTHTESCMSRGCAFRATRTLVTEQERRATATHLKPLHGQLRVHRFEAVHHQRLDVHSKTRAGARAPHARVVTLSCPPRNRTTCGSTTGSRLSTPASPRRVNDTFTHAHTRVRHATKVVPGLLERLELKARVVINRLVHVQQNWVRDAVEAPLGVGGNALPLAVVPLALVGLEEGRLRNQLARQACESGEQSATTTTSARRKHTP